MNEEFVDEIKDFYQKHFQKAVEEIKEYDPDIDTYKTKYDLYQPMFSIKSHIDYAPFILNDMNDKFIDEYYDELEDIFRTYIDYEVSIENGVEKDFLNSENSDTILNFDSLVVTKILKEFEGEGIFHDIEMLQTDYMFDDDDPLDRKLQKETEKLIKGIPNIIEEKIENIWDKTPDSKKIVFN